MKGSHKFWIAFWLLVLVVVSVELYKENTVYFYIIWVILFFIQQLVSAVCSYDNYLPGGPSGEVKLYPAKRWAQYTSILYWVHTLLKRFNKLLDNYL